MTLAEVELLKVAIEITKKNNTFEYQSEFYSQVYVTYISLCNIINPND